jgi:hypothetical protein
MAKKAKKKAAKKTTKKTRRKKKQHEHHRKSADPVCRPELLTQRITALIRWNQELDQQEPSRLQQTLKKWKTSREWEVFHFFVRGPRIEGWRRRCVLLPAVVLLLVICFHSRILWRVRAVHAVRQPGLR